MKIAIFSDTHDHWDNIKQACRLANEAGAELMIHCGDICAPITLGELRDNWQKEIHYCFGNVDGDRFLMIKNWGSDPLIHHYGEVLGELEKGGRRIAFQHYPQVARPLAESGRYDAVFYGHDHYRHQEQIGDTLLANPGNLCGIKAPPSFAVYETEDNTLRHLALE